ncbi:APC family permease [Sedimentibacter sp. MB31-C6]|uniref:APC family permease n=1 Tax=Sedimentibacter sp. MB31-C6 TaxID=3109366 RepID=UPI002DDDBAFA|nr:APC family permease [Sedimentibacter sp. MB36-C1]WSI03207.1 APC family permease [Sedimentibacter sp. MB36-C1]
MNQQKYSIFTTIAMIVGIVIGSGIFFKSDNVLVYTSGNILLGIIVFVIAAFSIIFGSLSISELASRTDVAGGIVTYCETYWNKSIACAYGWFQTFIYYPTIICVVAWVSGIYITMLFGIESTLEIQVLIGLIVITVLYLINLFSYKVGGYFQNASTIIKLVPLIIIAAAGIIFGNPIPVIQNNFNTATQVGLSWVAAIGPIAFSFDGWIVSTSICHEIKNSKRNLPLALIISPIIILTIYVLYFIGISTFLGADKVMNMGDTHVNEAAIRLFGEMGARLILTFIVISVLGTVNGVIIGMIRMPYSLSIRNMFPKSSKYNVVSEKYSVPIKSGIITYIINITWMIIHYITQKFNMLPNSDVSEISIVINYIGFILMYIAVINLARKGDIKNKVKGYVVPVLAIIGSLFILYGGMQNPLFIYYALFCITVIVLALVYYEKTKK